MLHKAYANHNQGVSFLQA